MLIGVSVLGYVGKILISSFPFGNEEINHEEEHTIIHDSSTTANDKYHPYNHRMVMGDNVIYVVGDYGIYSYINNAWNILYASENVLEIEVYGSYIYFVEGDDINNTILRQLYFMDTSGNNIQLVRDTTSDCDHPRIYNDILYYDSDGFTHGIKMNSDGTPGADTDYYSDDNPYKTKDAPVLLGTPEVFDVVLDAAYSSIFYGGIFNRNAISDTENELYFIKDNTDKFLVGGFNSNVFILNEFIYYTTQDGKIGFYNIDTQETRIIYEGTGNPIMLISVNDEYLYYIENFVSLSKTMDQTPSGVGMAYRLNLNTVSSETIKSIIYSDISYHNSFETVNGYMFYRDAETQEFCIASEDDLDLISSEP